MHGAVQHPVEFLHLGHALGVGRGEKLAVELLGRHGQVARRQRVADRQGGLVGDRIGDGVLVQIAPRVVGAEDLEGALAGAVRSIGVPVKPMIVAAGRAAIRQVPRSLATERCASSMNT